MKSKTNYCRQLCYRLKLPGNKDQTGMAGITANRPIVIINLYLLVITVLPT